METSEKKKKRPPAMPVLRIFVKAAWNYPVILLFIAIGIAFDLTANLVAPLYLREFIDSIAESTPGTGASVALFGILVWFGAFSLLGWLGRRIEVVAVQHEESKVMSNLSNDAFSYLIRHSHDYFTSNFAGTLTRRVTRYARAFEQILDIVVYNFITTGLFVIGVIYIMFQRSAVIGFVLIVWTIIFVLIQYFLTRWKQSLRVERAAADSAMTGVLSDAISNQPTVTIFASAPHEQKLFGDSVERWRAALMRSWNADAWIGAIQGLIALTIEIGLLAGAVLLWDRGLFSVGDFVLIQVYIIGLVDRLWGIGNSMRRLYEAFADADEMVLTFETPYAVADKSEAKPIAVQSGEVAFVGVNFSFDETKVLLKDLMLTIRGSEKVALVGPSGAGKSTITKLLLRFYDVTGGSICIDGQDIRDVTLDSLHEAIAFVPQEPILFHRSLMDNIRYGKKDATDEEVYEAAKKAHCHEFISQLPEGYATHVGERGVKLSGGERQRVAIARAILKDAPILILDEATSSLDSESESLIQDALKVLMEGKTVIVIAHRLSTIMTMDRIIVIEKGAVAAEGTHDELLNEKGGLYHKLWSIQAGSFVADTTTR